jgi:hypothetical protein
VLVGIQRPTCRICRATCRSPTWFQLFTHDHRIHKKSYQSFDLRTISVGDRGTHGNILLARMFAERDLQSSEQCHEQRDAFLPAQAL